MNINTNKVRSSYPSNAKLINSTISTNDIIDLNIYLNKDQFVLATQDTPQDKQVTLQIDQNGNLLGKNTEKHLMLSERILQDYAITCLPSILMLQNTKRYDHNMAQKDLEYLNRKLDTVRKTITAGDVYNIRGVAKNEDEVNHMLSTAPLNTAFISNCRVDTKDIFPGDIIFTDLNKRMNVIKHGTSGYFYPAKGVHKAANTYTLTYSGSVSDPVKAEKTLTSTIQPPCTNMNAEVQVSNNVGFAKTYQLNEYLQDGYEQPINGYPIADPLRVPLITIFTTTGEKIGLDNCLSFVSGQGILTNHSAMKVIVEVR